MKKIFIICLLALLTYSCSSSNWSCKKRYVTKEYYQPNKHHVKQSFDYYLEKKYNLKPKS